MSRLFSIQISVSNFFKFLSPRSWWSGNWQFWDMCKNLFAVSFIANLRKIGAREEILLTDTRSGLQNTWRTAHIVFFLQNRSLLWILSEKQFKWLTSGGNLKATPYDGSDEIKPLILPDSFYFVIVLYFNYFKLFFRQFM